MGNKIVLKEIRQDDSHSIVLELEIDEELLTLWYDIEMVNCDYRGIIERFDSVAVTFLLFAMLNGYDLCSNYPISEKLWYQLTYHVIPQIYKCNPKKTHLISIKAPLSNECYSGGYRGTGISCGVDSLTTIFEYSELCDLEEYRLTHLVYFKTGAHDAQLGKFDADVENRLFDEQLRKAKVFCEKASFPLMIIDSNLNEVLSHAFGFTAYERTHTFRSSGTMLLFQNYFTKYYYADTYGLDAFFVDIDKDVAHYEKWLLPLLSTESMEFYSANRNMSRLEKTRLLSDYTYSYDNLLVCWHEGENCGCCNKCVRTLATLDILGKLDLYKNSFKVDDWKKNREKYMARVCIGRKSDMFFKEIYQYMKENNIAMPALRYCAVELLKKIYRKIK